MLPRNSARWAAKLAAAGPSRHTAPRLLSTSRPLEYPRQPALRATEGSAPSPNEQQPLRTVEEEQEALLRRLDIPSVEPVAAPSASASASKPWFLEEEVIHSSEGDSPVAAAAAPATSASLSTSTLPPSIALPDSISDLFSPSHLGQHSSLLSPNVDVVHATALDPDAWVEWIVVAEVKSGRTEDVARVALDVGEWLKYALAPADESNRRLEDLLGAEEAVKKRHPKPSTPPRPPAPTHERWAPRHILSREAIEGIRLLHAADPSEYSIKALSSRFKVSYEAVARILKSRWVPDGRTVERQNRRAREREEEWRAQRGADRLGSREREMREEEELLKRFADEAVDPEEHQEEEEQQQQRETDERIPLNRVEYEGLILPSELLARATDDAALATGAQQRGKRPKKLRSSSRTSAQAASRGEGEWCMVKTDWCVVHVMTPRARGTWDVLRPWRESGSAI